MNRRTIYLAFLSTVPWLHACSEGSSTGGADCSTYLSETALGMVTFTVKNNQAAPVYLSAGQCSPRFWIKAPGFTSTAADHPSGFDVTCDKGQNSKDFPIECYVDPVVPLAPGGTTTVPWDGLVYEFRTMPASCYHPSIPFTPTGCLKGKTPKQGALGVDVTVNASAECGDGGPGCYATGNPTTVSQSFNYPADKQVEVDIN